MNDTISRQAAIEHLKKRLYETALNNVTEHPYYEEMADNRVSVWLKEVPSVQPEIIRCKDCKYNSNTCGNYVNCDIIPQMFGRTTDNFCSRAERRTDEPEK